MLVQNQCIKRKQFTWATWNVQSMQSPQLQRSVCQHLVNRKIDVCAVQETHIVKTGSVKIYGYTLFHQGGELGSGLGIFCS